MKKVGIIIIGVLLAFLLLVVIVWSVSKSKKVNRENTSPKQSSQSINVNERNSQQEVEKNQVDRVQKTTEVITTPRAEVADLDKGYSMSKEIVTMEELDLNTVPYKNKYTTEICTISDKKAYFDEKQIYYSLKIYLKGVNKYIDYYVGYSTYNAFEVNDSVNVEYEKFENGIVSITSISNR